MSGTRRTEPLPAPRPPFTASPVGIFGGTFDPIHFGHLRLAEEMADMIGLGQVRFIPAGQPPHRDAPGTGAAHRLEMARLAVAGNPRFTVDAREVASPRPSYTVDTLAALRAEFGDDQPLWLLLGADAFHGLPTWHEWRRLFELANLAVAARPGAGTMQSESMPDSLKHELSRREVADASAAAAAGSVLLRPMTPLDISASAIRGTLARHGSVRYLLPDAVLDYIHEHHLYALHEH